MPSAVVSLSLARSRMLPRMLLLPLALLAGAAQGCVAEECKTQEGKDATCISLPDRFEGRDFEQTLAESYEPGTDIIVSGVYGDINIRQGDSGEVSMVVKPFAYGSHSSQAEAADKMRDNLHAAINVQDRSLELTTRRDDTELPLVGADLDVFIPPEFDGALVVTNQGNGTWNPGNIKVYYTAEAPSVEARATSLSDCFIDVGPSVTYTAARCDGDIKVRGANDEVSLETQGQLGTIDVQFASILTGEGGRIKAGSDISVRFPSDAQFTVQASAGESVDLDGLSEASCAVEAAAVNSKSATCGDGGPNYVITSHDGTISASF